MFARHRSLFKAHDIRGSALLFDDAFMVALATSFAKLYSEHSSTALVLGYDARPQSKTLALTFLPILQKAGIHIIWLGLTTTPAMAYFAHTKTAGNGIIMTASHSPKDILGLKWLVHGNSPDSEQIENLFAQLTPCPPIALPPNPAPISFQPYTQALLQVFNRLNRHDLSSMTLVIDCLNGATSHLASTIFAQLGVKWIMLNNNPDGTFPKGNPDPTEPNRLAELQTAVLAHKADLGLAFDGDGDRLAVVDDKGRVVASDWLIWLLAQASQTTPAPVIFDIKCSHTLTRLFKARHITPIMVKTGSSHLRRLLQGDHRMASFAGELSGHFIFNDGKFICHDDGIYAGLRLLAYLGNKKLSSILDNLPPIVATPDLYLDAPNDNPKAFMQNLTTLIQHSSLKNHLIDIDGVRLEFDTGFILMRASNTANQLTLRATFDSQHDFQRISQNFCELLTTLDSNFANSIAQTLHHYGELSV